jgi:hypothetical protein
MVLTDREAKLLENYRLMNYDAWDYSGKGDNMLPFLTELEEEIWNQALPYQDKRHDPGHTETVVYFAHKLLSFHPEADRDIIIPAAILHDAGWGLMAPGRRELFSSQDRKVYEPELRAEHQEYGAQFARKVLEAVNYAKRVGSFGQPGESMQEHIIEIISQHDTRKGFFSQNDYAMGDGLVRDADKLWRSTLTAIVAEATRTGTDVREVALKQDMSFQKPGLFYSPISMQMAFMELYHSVRRTNERPDLVEKIRSAIREHDSREE